MPHDPPHATPAPYLWPLLFAADHPDVLERIREKHPTTRDYKGCPCCGGIAIAITSDSAFRRRREEAYVLIDDREMVELVRPLVTARAWPDPIVVLLWPH